MQYAPQIKVSDGMHLGATIARKGELKIWADEFIAL